MKRRELSRRTFLHQAALVSAPMILPSGVLAQPGRPGANDRPVIGHIGVGGMGRNHVGRLQDYSAAVCDVDTQQFRHALDIIGRPVQTYTDYRRVLDRDDIDAVVIATPDHWHGLMAVHACEAGKDVYVEKPASKTVEEGRAMVDAAERYGRVVQVGSQGRSLDKARAACNYIRNGQIGPVDRVECWHYENPVGGDCTKNGPAPDHLDWDMWLGPAEWECYNPDRCHFNFRWFLDFGGGQIRDRGAHVLSLVAWFLDLDERHPVKVTATGTPPETGMWDCPTEMEVTYAYKDPDLTIVWRQPGTQRMDAPFGAEYIGADGRLIVTGGDGAADTEDKALEYDPPADGYHAFDSPGHMQNWLDCMRSREKPLMHIGAGHAVATLCILANIAYRIERPIEWDGENERILNDEQANRLLGSAGRGPWHL